MAESKLKNVISGIRVLTLVHLLDIELNKFFFDITVSRLSFSFWCEHHSPSAYCNLEWSLVPAVVSEYGLAGVFDKGDERPYPMGSDGLLPEL